jgi:hypothetical protein
VLQSTSGGNDLRRGGNDTVAGLRAALEISHQLRLGARLVALLAATGVVALWPMPAAASEIVDRNVVRPVLRVDADGRAGISYTVNGRVRHVLVWDAVDAYSPQSGTHQVKFKKDYAGGWGAFRKDVVATMVNRCTPVAMPSLPWLVTACRAPDGSFWALQRWQRMLPNLGLDPWRREQEVWELHVSHWTGEIAKLEVYSDWAYSGRFHHLFGRLSYRGAPVYGFSTTPTGAPLDGWGRNLYLDTLDSAYGKGWRRENSFLAHKGTGVFCYGFYTHAPYAGYPAGTRPPGHGRRYRITVLGPGVTPAVSWEGAGIPDYDETDPAFLDRERQMNLLRRSWNDRLCRKD